MILRFGRRSQEVDAWPNIDSFLRRFNDPETAETFNESAAPAAAAAASAPHAIDSFGDAFTFFLCLAQITQAAAAAAAAATGNQHKISAFHCCSCFVVAFAVFLRLILQSQQFGCAFVSTHFMCQRNRLRLLLLPDNQNTNWQCGKWLLHWHWPWQGIIHSLTQNGELSVGPTFNGVTQQLVVAATMLQVPLSACSSLS